jgi:predicted dehydrogenase
VKEFRWGILGTGFAARKFVLGLRAAEAAKAVLVVSRSSEKAERFARSLDILRAYGRYKQALDDDAVDAFYVATPPSMHCEHALLCLNAGKPVLVEKPFAVNAIQARQIVEVARARSVFCMEAMWTRFMPLVQRVKSMVVKGLVGDVRLLTGSFGVAESPDPRNNLFSSELGGGALLDRGVYPISLAFHLMGPPEGIVGDAIIGNTGVDEEVAVTFRYKTGGLGILHASLRTQCSNDLVIMGTDAQIHLYPPIYRPFRMTVTPIQPRAYAPSGPSRMETLKETHWVHHAFQRFSGLGSPVLNRHSKRHSERYAGNGYHYQADEVMHCVRNGTLESAIMPLSESLSIMEAMDTIRSQWAAQTGHSGGDRSASRGEADRSGGKP